MRTPKTTVSVSFGARERLRALAVLCGSSTPAILETLSYADFADLLSLTATQAHRERRMESATAADIAAAALRTARNRQRRSAA